MLHLATLGGAAISDPTQFSFGKADRPDVKRAAPLLFFDSQCGNGTGSPSSHVWALAAVPSIAAFGYASCRDMRARLGSRDNQPCSDYAPSPLVPHSLHHVKKTRCEFGPA